MTDFDAEGRLAFAMELELRGDLDKAVQAFEEMGHRVELWPGSLPDTGDVWGALIATDIYAQLSEVLEKERDQIGRTLVAVLDQVTVGDPPNGRDSALTPTGDVLVRGRDDGAVELLDPGNRVEDDAALAVDLAHCDEQVHGDVDRGHNDCEYRDRVRDADPARKAHEQDLQGQHQEEKRVEMHEEQQVLHVVTAGQQINELHDAGHERQEDKHHDRNVFHEGAGQRRAPVVDDLVAGRANPRLGEIILQPGR